MIENPSLPRMKSFVPSIGSTNHTRGDPSAPAAGGDSSLITGSPGNAAASRAMINSLAFLSATVTGSLPAFISTSSSPPR